MSAGLEGTGGLAFLVLGVGLPVEGAFCTVAVLLSYLAEDLACIGPSALIDGFGAVRIETAVLSCEEEFRLHDNRSIGRRERGRGKDCS